MLSSATITELAIMILLIIEFLLMSRFLNNILSEEQKNLSELKKKLTINSEYVPKSQTSQFRTKSPDKRSQQNIDQNLVTGWDEKLRPSKSARKQLGQGAEMADPPKLRLVNKRMELYIEDRLEMSRDKADENDDPGSDGGTSISKIINF